VPERENAAAEKGRGAASTPHPPKNKRVLSGGLALQTDLRGGAEMKDECIGIRVSKKIVKNPVGKKKKI